MAGTNLVRWDPWHDLASFRQTMDRFMGDALGGLDGDGNRRWMGEEQGARNVALDIMEGPDHFVVKAAVPGYRPDDVEITVENDVLTLKGQHRDEQKNEQGEYLRREIRWGSFERSMRIPPTVDAEQAHAEFQDGVLTLSLPKKPEAKPKAIKITPREMIEGK